MLPPDQVEFLLARLPSSIILKHRGTAALFGSTSPINTLVPKAHSEAVYRSH